MARGAFRKMSKVFQRHDFSLGTKTRLLHISYLIIYEAETWTLTQKRQAVKLRL